MHRWQRRVDSHNSDGIVIKDGRDIFGGEFVCRVADEKTSLAHGTITNNHTPADSSLAIMLGRSPLPPSDHSSHYDEILGTFKEVQTVGRTHFIVATTIVTLSTLPSCDHRTDTGTALPFFNSVGLICSLLATHGEVE